MSNSERCVARSIYLLACDSTAIFNVPAVTCLCASVLTQALDDVFQFIIFSVQIYHLQHHQRIDVRTELIQGSR